jgi:S-adenosylmethionine:tRNA ribosyltransferase-isomerase
MKLLTENFQYHLPTEKIALHPLKERDESKLLVSKDGSIHHFNFKQLSACLPENTFLFFNNTKVIPARLHFKKETGAQIEIFLLNPIEPSSLLIEAMSSMRTCTWHCTIGNLKKWPSDKALTIEGNGFAIEASLIDQSEGSVQFTWNPDISFAELLELAGETPLPPYLKRKAEAADKTRYQTVYSKFEGAVAAPTAGLHFTDQVFHDLEKRSIGHDFLTLHVSAGTFQPIKAENANEHVMHQEQIIVTRKNLENLLKEKFIIPVGTTSMRTLESLYWYGARLLKNSNASFKVEQDDPYKMENAPDKQASFEAIIKLMNEKGVEQLIGETSIFIKPGYDFKVCDALITNFHQPGSTLILLVAAFTGEHWKKIYNEALENNYRFLSFGDSSLLFR